MSSHHAERVDTFLSRAIMASKIRKLKEAGIIQVDIIQELIKSDLYDWICSAIGNLECKVEIENFRKKI